MTFNAPTRTPFVALLFVHPEIARDLRRPEYLDARTESGDPVPVETYLDSFGNRSARFVAPAGRLALSYDNVITRPDEPEPEHQDAEQHPVESLPLETL